MTAVTALVRAALLGALAAATFRAQTRAFGAADYHRLEREANLLHSWARIARRDAEVSS